MNEFLDLSLELQRAIQQRICEADETIIADRHDVSISEAERFFWETAELPIKHEEIDLAFQDYDLALAAMYEEMILGAFWAGVQFAVFGISKGEELPFELLDSAPVLNGAVGD
jgi:hypothetical protein